VFIDESGKPTKKEGTPFVVSALIVDDRTYLRIRRDINVILRDVLGDVISERRFRVDGVEVHAREVVQGEGFFRGVDIGRRAALLRRVSHYVGSELRGAATSVSVVIVKKRVLNTSSSEGEVREAMVKKAFGLLMERVAWYLSDYDNELALLLVDKSEIDYDVRNAVLLEITQGLYTSQLTSSERILETPLFIDSKRHRPLQLADFIAYTLFRIYSGKPVAAGGVFNFRAYLSNMEPIIRKGSKGQVAGYGIKVWEF